MIIKKKALPFILYSFVSYSTYANTAISYVDKNLLDCSKEVSIYLESNGNNLNFPLSPNELRVVKTGEQSRVLLTSGYSSNGLYYVDTFFSNDRGKIWKLIDRHYGENGSLDGVTNPTVAFDSTNNRTVRAVFEPDRTFQEGALWTSESLDNGRTFSEWKRAEIGSNILPDKPFLEFQENGALSLVFTALQSTNGDSQTPWTSFIRLLDRFGTKDEISFEFGIGAYPQGPALEALKNGETLLSYGHYEIPSPLSSQIHIRRIGADVSPLLSNPVIVANNSGVSTPVTEVASSIDGEIIGVVWHDAHTLNKPVYLAVSSDGGETFTTPIILAQKGGLPTIEITNNKLVVHLIEHIVDSTNNLESYAKTYIISIAEIRNGNLSINQVFGTKINSPRSFYGSTQQIIIAGEDDIETYTPTQNSILRTNLSYKTCDK